MKLILALCILAEIFAVNTAQDASATYEVQSECCVRFQETASTKLCQTTILFFINYLYQYQCSERGDLITLYCASCTNEEGIEYPSCDSLFCKKSNNSVPMSRSTTDDL